jgi:hypothetical protein
VIERAGGPGAGLIVPPTRRVEGFAKSYYWVTRTIGVIDRSLVDVWIAIS